MCNIVLETPRLLLRNWQESDLEFFTKMNANPVVMRYFPDLTFRLDDSVEKYAKIEQKLQELQRERELRESSST